MCPIPGITCNALPGMFSCSRIDCDFALKLQLHPRQGCHPVDVGPDDGKIGGFCAEWATPMSDDPPICKSNGFALQRKPTGGRITLNAASIWGISVYHITHRGT
jgi:hypothetical protein